MNGLPYSDKVVAIAQPVGTGIGGSMGGSNGVAICQSRMQQPPQDAQDHRPYEAVDCQVDDDHGQHHAKPDQRNRCNQSKHATKEDSFKAIVGCAYHYAHDDTGDYPSSKPVPVAGNIGDSKLLHDRLEPKLGDAGMCRRP